MLLMTKDTKTKTQRFLIRMENKLNHHNLRMKDVAEASGITEAAISLARNGKTKKMKQETMDRIEMTVRGLTE